MGPFGSNSFALCPLSAVWMVTLRLEKKFNQFEHHSQLQWHQIELHIYMTAQQNLKTYASYMPGSQDYT